VTTFVQQVVDGLSSGSIYAALALALVLVYRATGLVNFAQAQMGVVSAYVAWALTQAGLPAGLAVACAVVASLAMGAAVDRGLIRRFERSDPLVAIVATVAVLICLNGLVSLVWGADLKAFPDLFPSTTYRAGGVHVTAAEIGNVAVLLAVVAVLWVLFQHTRLGLALRAVAENPESSALSGLPVGLLLMAGWALAALVGGLAGCLIAPKVSLQPNMMDGILVYALAAAVLGGLDSPLGAVLAAWIIGVVENLAGTYVGFIGNDLKIAVPLVLMAVVLLVRPQGLFGRPEVQRV
jgi:branched-chain amino acid transport system permease protein